jgi:hypothetical protein
MTLLTGPCARSLKKQGLLEAIAVDRLTIPTVTTRKHLIWEDVMAASFAWKIPGLAFCMFPGSLTTRKLDGGVSQEHLHSLSVIP